MENNEKKSVGLEISPEVAKGNYSNLAVISHSPQEFTLDFASVLPGMPKPIVGNRIIMTPANAKRLFMALQDNIIRYENEFGNISLDMRPKQSKGTFNFEDFNKGGNSGENKS